MGKVTLCGSILFYDEMLKVKSQLEKMSHEVKIPPEEIKDEEGRLVPIKEYYTLRQDTSDAESWIWKRKKEAMLEHFEKINQCDGILVLNYDKNKVRNYIGPNTLIEMGVAMYLGKEIYLLNDIPEISYKEEILGTMPTILKGDLTKIK